ncbi:MAG: 50S ribosomal protein L29 [Caldisericia bacterium]|nr:50S ribosomal protein L29 [Caldisericia bacterium]
MKKEKIKAMSLPEMETELKKLEMERVRLVFKHKNRQLDKVMKLREVKLDIVRLKTFIQQKEEGTLV